MISIWIDEEPFKPEEESIRIIGELAARYYIGPWDYDNYDEDTKQMLFEFFYEQNHCPLYITFEPFDDVYNDIVTGFDKEGIEYSITNVQKKRSSFPVFNVIANESKSLKVILDEAFWLACANQFFAISLEDNICYEIGTMKNWYGKMIQIPLPHFKMADKSTVITLFHDAQGLYVFTNNKKYSSIENLRSQLPNTMVIKQIKGDVVDNNSSI